MLIVYSKINTPRFYYSLKLVLKEVCKQEYKIVHTKAEIPKDANIINYSGERINNSFQIHPFGLLSEKDYRKFDISFDYGGDEMVKLFLTEFDHLGFDIFSASLFLATRMEEYWKYEADKHGRYPSKESIMSKLGVLHLPLINIWGKVFLQKISSFFQKEFTCKRKFSIVNTIDIDNAWAYKNKGLFRTVGGLTQTLLQANFKDTEHRINVLFGKKDPYDTYDYIKETTQIKNIKSIFFFLMGDRNTYDKSVPHENKHFKQLIQEIQTFADIGIHPSYASYLSPEIQKKEIKRLEKITGQKITKARKHYLKLTLPDSYRIYEQNGIKEDYTMGYADNIGFRAGISTPYTFFDLLQNRELNLTIHPFVYMDGTLNQYLKLSPEKAIERINHLKTTVKNIEGQFIGIWHNETLNEQGIWKGWKKVYEQALND